MTERCKAQGAFNAEYSFSRNRAAASMGLNCGERGCPRNGSSISQSFDCPLSQFQERAKNAANSVTGNRGCNRPLMGSLFDRFIDPLWQEISVNLRAMSNSRH